MTTFYKVKYAQQFKKPPKYLPLTAAMQALATEANTGANIEQYFNQIKNTYENREYYQDLESGNYFPRIVEAAGATPGQASISRMQPPQMPHIQQVPVMPMVPQMSIGGASPVPLQMLINGVPVSVDPFTAAIISMQAGYGFR